MNHDWLAQRRRHHLFPQWLRNEVHNNQAGADGVAGGRLLPTEPRSMRVTAQTTGKPNEIIITYIGPGNIPVALPGLYVWPEPISLESNYFEVEILSSSEAACSLCLGIVPYEHDLDKQPGQDYFSVGLQCDSGRLFKHGRLESTLDIRPLAGHRVGCGVRRRVRVAGAPAEPGDSVIFYTHNGMEVAAAQFLDLAESFHPAIGLSSLDDNVMLCLGRTWASQDKDGADVTPMSVDSHDDDWLRLHNVKQNGQVLEYAGKGKSIDEVGLAQAKTPLSPANHYFELEILEPGAHCYIAIGLARKDYPLNRHPGWNIGSIAYHADDGKIFVGKGTGDPFGPTCNKGDVMGCGILFPVKGAGFRLDADCSTDDSDADTDSPVRHRAEKNEAAAKAAAKLAASLGGNSEGSHSPSSASSDPEEENALNLDADDANDADSAENLLLSKLMRLRFHRQQLKSVAKLRQIAKAVGPTSEVQVYFTRNGKLVGKRRACLPSGEYFPTIGMLSRGERVLADLRPLTG